MAPRGVGKAGIGAFEIDGGFALKLTRLGSGGTDRRLSTQGCGVREVKWGGEVN